MMMIYLLNDSFNTKNYMYKHISFEMEIVLEHFFNVH